MPITYCGPGDILTTKATTIVIPVNTMGVMGSGFALWYKLKYPEQFARYKKACVQGTLRIGRLLEQTLPSGGSALLFPTKDRFYNDSTLEYIESGLLRFTELYEIRNCRSIAFPALGCGRGGLEFIQVKPLLYRYLDPLPIPIEIYSHYQKE